MTEETPPTCLRESATAVSDHRPGPHVGSDSLTANVSATHVEPPKVCASSSGLAESCAVLSKKVAPSAELLGVGDCDLEAVRDGVCVEEGVNVDVVDGVWVCDDVWVMVCVIDGLDDGVCVCDGVCDGVWLCEGDTLWVGDCDCVSDCEGDCVEV